MAKIDLEDSRWCELAFEGRNQAYGAYDLRSKYSTNLKLALASGLVCFSLALSSPIIKSHLFPEGMEEVDVTLNQSNELLAPPPVDKNQAPPPPPPPQEPPPPVRSTIKYTPPVIKRDEEVRDEDIPPPQEAIKTDVGKETVKGNDDAPQVIEEPVVAAPAEKPVEVEAEEEVLLFAEESPEYPGGAGAMYGYIGKSIRYPSQAKRMGLEGTVVLAFVVEKDGSISNVSAVRGIGGGCDEEAARVVASMPKWKPAKQNGKSVRMRFTLPVKFQLQ